VLLLFVEAVVVVLVAVAATAAVAEMVGFVVGLLLAGQ
jgi:hypothetical protein